MVTASYVVLVVIVGLQRLLELRVSKQNEAELKAQGGIEHAAEQMPYMAALHGAWLVACIGEVLLLDRPVHTSLLVVSLLVFCLGQALRLSAIHALGARWNVRVITLPGAPPVEGGIFRFLRHPNYLGVILEVAALPLIHSAYLTALVFSVANGLLLQQRIRAEERALGASGDYGPRLGTRPKLLPNIGSLVRVFRKRQTAAGER